MFRARRSRTTRPDERVNQRLLISLQPASESWLLPPGHALGQAEMTDTGKAVSSGNRVA